MMRKPGNLTNPDELIAAWTSRPRRGFALVVTLTMMILLTVIAVGLLSLSSITLRTSNMGKDQRIARENARMALMFAIGELQKYASQDQRITAIADIAGNADGTTLASNSDPHNDKPINAKAKPKGLSSVQSGTRYWTGIFVNQDAPASIYTQTPSPLIVNWLVSGNTTTWPDGGPAILPSDSTYAVAQNGEVSDPDKAVVLVGGNSVGTSGEGLDRTVTVPLVYVLGKDAQGKVTKTPVARYGWWVGDEGVKAKVNIPKSLDDPANYAALAAQRRGLEIIDGFKAYPPAAASRESIPKLITFGEIPLLVPGVRSSSGGPSPLQSIFHSATTDSRGLLTDTLRGGTKIDLTTILDGALPSSNPLSTINNYPVKGANIIPSIKTDICDTTKLVAPKWDALKDFNDRGKNLNGGSLICKAAASTTDSSIGPIIIDFRLLMGAKIITKAADSFNIDACGKIAVAIANPYSRNLKWNNDLEIEVRNLTNTSQSPSRIWNLGSPAAFIPQCNASGVATEPAVFNSAVFRIRAASLAPGEARAYSIAGPIKRAAADATSRLVIDLAPFGSSSPFDFNNCVELENTNTYGNIPSLDVRESAESSLIGVEMRLAGSSNILHRAERFELDNGYYANNIRSFSNADAAQMTQPFPLMCYSFQISQPGVNYLSLMPSGYEMGQRGSTLRTFTDFNLQAAHIRRPIASYSAPPYFMESNDSISLLPTVAPGGDTGTGFTRNLALSPLPWGRSPAGSQKTILFSVPSQLVSLAQLQHADLTGDDFTASIGHQPGNAVGNSYATLFVKRGLLSRIRTDYTICPNTQAPTHYYDICHLLNSSLWDSYYFSTLSQSRNANPENPTLVRIPISNSSSKAAKDPLAPATFLMIDGAFNCNSTDKNAWKIFLASARHFKHSADTANKDEAAFPRTLEQISTSALPPTGNDADSFSGFRRLTDNQLDALATEIVKQVRIRGPFVSLSHFVNRTLATLTAQPELTRCGPLQFAIDQSGANIDFAGEKNAFSRIDPTADRVTLVEKQGAPRADFDGDDSGGRPPDADPSTPDWAVTDRDNNYGTVSSILADREMFKDSRYKPEQGYRSTGIPGWLTQADVLQVIGPALTTRSDTFRIRAFGEALDPNGKSTAKAYCEATVQRMPDYVDPADPPTARGEKLSNLNTTYGRQFQIISFRWLSPNEI